jgi:HEAT repeat protein
MSDTRHVFISYSRQEKDFVDQLRADLEQSGVTVWIDTKGIRPGAFSWEEVIREAIEHAFAVLLIASPDARKSPYVKGELAIAQMYNHPVYPIWAAGKSWIDCVPMNMAETQHIDARDGKYSSVLSQIVEALGGERPELALAAPEVPDVVLRNPYKGLLAFTEDDKEFFFGREKLTDTLADALDSCFTTSKPKLIAVVGASGSGKSSVVMAGLLPRLDKKMWHVLRIFPGTKPLDALMYALADVYDKSMSVIEEDLQNPNGLGLHRIARRLAKSGQRVLLFVDQFEEVFTLAESEYQRRQFLNLLTNAAIESDSVLATVLTMRADYYDRPMNYPQFGELVQNSAKSVMAMSLLELLEAIEQPTMRVGLHFESSIVTEMVNELRDRAGALPLLQFTLNQLYEKRAGSTLTRAAYTEIGGVQGAIGHHADEVFDALPQETQDALPRVAAKLVNIDETATPTRRRALLSEFDGHESSQNLVDALVNARLLIAGKEDSVYVEVSHEALLTHWSKLVATIEANKEGLQQLRRLEADAREWERLGRPKDMLWSHARLKPIYELCASFGLTFDNLTAEFAKLEVERLIEEFSVASMARRETIIERWLEMGIDAIPSLIEVLKHEDNDVRMGAARVLGQSGNNVATPAIIEMLNDQNRYIRHAGVRALGELGDKSAIPSMIDALRDENQWVREEAVLSLRRLGDKTAVPALIKALDEDPDITHVLINALRDLKDTRALPALMNFVGKEKSWESRKAAREGVETLIKLVVQTNDLSFTSFFLGALKDKSQHVRREAAWALWNLGDKITIPALIKALRDSDRNVRYYAVRALENIHDERAIEALQKVALNDSDIGVKQSSTWALARFGDFSNAALLIPALKNNTLADAVKADYAAALEKWGTPEALEAVQQWRASQEDSG